MDINNGPCKEVNNMNHKGYELLVACQPDSLLKEVKVTKDGKSTIVTTHTTDAQKAFKQVKELIDRGYFPHQSTLDNY